MRNGHPAAFEHRFAALDQEYERAGFLTVPVGPDKRPLGKGWNKSDPTPDDRAGRRAAYPDAHIGIKLGTILENGSQFACVDCDDDRLVPFAEAAFGPVLSGKVGQKGVTSFLQAEPELKSRKILSPVTGKPVLEFMVDTGMVVIPPSRHPAGMPYRWVGKPLLEADLTQLPQLTERKLWAIERIFRTAATWTILEGGPDIKCHQPLLSLTASGIANIDDDAWLVPTVQALLHPEYRGSSRKEIPEMLASARAKGLGTRPDGERHYNPGAHGPIPLGYTKDGTYALLDPVRQIIIPASSTQLMSGQYLVGLAPSRFWSQQFPSTKSAFNSYSAGEAILTACRAKGGFDPARVRGRGIWREGDQIILNLGGSVRSDSYLYLCFQAIELAANPRFDAERLLRLIQKFKWRDPQDAMLCFGWLAIAPICGVFNWRPHVFVYGPPRSGKTTIHTIATAILRPLVLSADGQSSEAGIRQRIGPDSLPVIIDEFESDQHAGGLRQVLRLARSASSADTPVLRGTPEGKAMAFSLRTTFLFAAVNPRGLSPADQSRIMMLELLMHGNDSETARSIIEEEGHFRSQGPIWCSYMVSLAGQVSAAIDLLEPLIVSTDRRHRQNVSTLLAGAFVALHGRLPCEAEAKALAEEFGGMTTRHAEENERDDAQECLSHLLSYNVESFPLAHWLAVEHLGLSGNQPFIQPAPKILAAHDFALHTAGETPGLFIQNASSAMERVFRGTHWEGGAWHRALRKLPGSFKPLNPIHFTIGGKKRALGLPLEYVPDEPLQEPEDVASAEF